MIRRFLTGLAALLIAGSALAQDATPARFFIERIEVRNTHRVSSQLVIQETLLREGQEYSEQELRDASARLSRLPFLLSADLALEKGSDRGRHVLVISVMEAKPFFYLLDLRPTMWDESRRESGANYDLDIDPATESKDVGLGFRWFVGGRGIVHVGLVSRRDNRAFTSNYSASAIGYTQHGLFGTAAFATINLRMPFESPDASLLSPQLVVGVPITKTQTLTLDYDEMHLRDDTVTVVGQKFRQKDSERLVSLAWTYNTTNQPFVPTRGTIVRVAPFWSKLDRTSYTFTAPLPNPAPVPDANRRKDYGLDVAASHYWELTERDSVGAGVLGGWADVRDRNDPPVFRPASVRWRPTYEILRGIYSRNLWKGDEKNGASRLELELRYIAQQRNVREGSTVFGALPDDKSAIETSVRWARRSSWGMLRLGVGYAWER